VSEGFRRIGVVPGDGIGPEVVDEALRVLECLDAGLEFDVLPHINAETFLNTGTAMSDEDVRRVRAAGLVLFGAVGSPRVRTPSYARGVLLRLRTELDLYVNYRPAVLLHDRLSPLRDPGRRAIDCVVVRENTEGLYADVGGRLRPGTPHEVAIDEEVNTYLGVSRIVAFAFAVARRGVCLVDKSNTVRSGGQLWQRCWREQADRHPEMPTDHLYVDTAAVKLLADPTAFDVLVTNNSYGDILSDLTAGLAGGLGTAASANRNPESGFGLYEPVHGSAPDIAGTGLANPVGAVLSAALLLDDIGRAAVARAVRGAVRRTIAAHRCTPDLGGNLSTVQAGAAIRAELR
jgi:3-isopropylmalate dehydrogenase